MKNDFDFLKYREHFKKELAEEQTEELAELMAIHTETVKSNHPFEHHKNFNELDLNLLARVEAKSGIVSLTFMHRDGSEPKIVSYDCTFELMEQVLPKQYFINVNRGDLLNMKHFQAESFVTIEAEGKETNAVKLTEAIIVPVSRRRYQYVLNTVKKFRSHYRPE